ncbi:MAG TPA: hypothetical protein V6D22_10230 [Candidatus Obscuribacterales bacterium]
MDSLFGKLTKGAKDTGAKVSLAAKIAKLNVEIATQKSEKDRHIKNIGVKVYAIFAKNKQLDGKLIQEEIASELNMIERIDKHIEELQEDIARLQADFKNVEGSVVDASEVKESHGDTSDK